MTDKDITLIKYAQYCIKISPYEFNINTLKKMFALLFTNCILFYLLPPSVRTVLLSFFLLDQIFITNDMDPPETCDVDKNKE